MTLFENKYRIESTRLKGWDYTCAGWYFVTICTREHECVFGDILGGEMHLSAIGEIVAEEWQTTETIRPDVGLDEWIVMPNHLHGIMVIENTSVETPRRGVSTTMSSLPDPAMEETPRRGVSTNCRGICTTTKSRLKPHSLGSIIGQFKSVSTKRIRAAGYPSFFWQERFFDHVIRSERALEKIREYVVANPSKWDADRNNAVNLWT